MFGKFKNFIKARKLGNRRTMTQRAAGSSIDPTARPWSDLPRELLSLIANRLGIIQLLAFRGVCKSWRSASSTASADCESEVNTKPSFIVYDERDKQCSLYYRTDMDGPDGGRIYGLNIPELENATCLASNRGWLLLHQQGSLFFFCPFSRARIDLPDFPESELSNHVAAFSAPPTSHQCIVSVANRYNQDDLKLYVLRRGDGAWTEHKRYNAPGFQRTISAALYAEETSSFYFVGENKNLLRFSVEEEIWTSYYVVSVRSHASMEILPFNFQEHYFNNCDMKTWMGLQGDVSISVCGTLLPGRRTATYACNEKLEAPNGRAKTKLKGIWIEARFLLIQENQGWDL